jgi:hypothetical protein
MSYQWIGLTEMLPIVEFHDIRTEQGSSGKYLELVEGQLATPFAQAGGIMLGQFRVANHQERLVLLRGFASSESRHRTLAAFHRSHAWQARRAEGSALVRDASVMLTRTLAPAGRPQLAASASPTAIVSEIRFAEHLGDYHLGLRHWLSAAGIDPLAAFATLESVNDVPAVPVVRHRTHHITLLPRGSLPVLPPDLRALLRFSPEILELTRAPALVW